VRTRARLGIRSPGRTVRARRAVWARIRLSWLIRTRPGRSWTKRSSLSLPVLVWLALPRAVLARPVLLGSILARPVLLVGPVLVRTVLVRTVLVGAGLPLGRTPGARTAARAAWAVRPASAAWTRWATSSSGAAGTERLSLARTASCVSGVGSVPGVRSISRVRSVSRRGVRPEARLRLEGPRPEGRLRFEARLELVARVGSLSVPGIWPPWTACSLSWGLAAGMRATRGRTRGPVAARAAPGRPRSVRDINFFSHSCRRAGAARARSRAATTWARSGTGGTGRRVFLTWPLAAEATGVASRLAGRPRWRARARRHATLRAGARRVGRHVRRAGAVASRVATVTGIDGVSACVEISVLGVAFRVQVRGVGAPATPAPARSAVPTIHPVPPGRCHVRSAALTQTSVGLPGHPERARRLIALVRRRFISPGQRQERRLVRGLRTGLP
jgi:hypothetical protein